jgi:1,4-alpha-glucan branching enzyme
MAFPQIGAIEFACRSFNHGKGFAMYEMGRTKGSVSFKVKANGKTAKVAVAGDWNNWQPVAMKKQKDGSFVATVQVSPGRYEYKFIVDGKWVHDPDVTGVTPNPFGSLNSVMSIK